MPLVLQLMPVEEFSSGRSYMAQPSNDPASEGLVIEGVPAGEYRVTTQTAGRGICRGDSLRRKGFAGVNAGDWWRGVGAGD